MSESHAFPPLDPPLFECARTSRNRAFFLKSSGLRDPPTFPPRSMRSLPDTFSLVQRLGHPPFFCVRLFFSIHNGETRGRPPSPPAFFCLNRVSCRTRTARPDRIPSFSDFTATFSPPPPPRDAFVLSDGTVLKHATPGGLSRSFFQDRALTRHHLPLSLQLIVATPEPKAFSPFARIRVLF